MNRLAAWLYRLLLFAFPAPVRRDFGGEMARLFEHQLADARARGETTAVVWVSAAVPSNYSESRSPAVGSCLLASPPRAL